MLPAAELAIGARVDGLGRSDVRAALWTRRELVKTFGIRGTLHLFPASELPLWMAALKGRAAAQSERRLARLGIDAVQLDSMVDAVGAALDGRQLTLVELGAEIAARTGDWALEQLPDAWVTGWPKWRACLGQAAFEGLLCFAPNRGTAVTFARADRWIGGWKVIDPEFAQLEVFRRYLRAYGPATVGEFAQWFNLGAGAVRRLAGRLAAETVEVEIEGERRLLHLEDAERPAPDRTPSVRLLPHFDSYLRGSYPRLRLRAGPPHRAAGGTGRVPTLIVDGTVAGVWERLPGTRRLQVRVEPYVRVTSGLREALESETQRMAEFYGTEGELAIGAVQLRPHL